MRKPNTIENENRSYGYEDTTLVQKGSNSRWRWLAFFFAILLILTFWFALDQKLLFGDAWLSETYDNEDWRTNEGDLHTYGAWDLESHIWKTEFIMEWFPNIHWNPYWYLGMPLLKYYQAGFYIVHSLAILATGLSAARAALLILVFSHLLATLFTFLLCFKLSSRIWVSALVSLFVLSNSFLSLRSYGWEPITVTFLFLFPLGLLLFLKQPLHPFRFWLIIVLGLSYLTHPLLWFSLCMTMGIYLFSIAIRKTSEPNAAYGHYLWKYFALVFSSILIGAVQFFPQISYSQVSSGVHMGVTYLPFYHVASNIISFKDFLFDAGNLKGPGPVIMIALICLLFFAIIGLRERWQKARATPSKQGMFAKYRKDILSHEIIAGLALVLLIMILFYYFERYNIFPMNILRSIQYHRIIPEFIIVAAALIAAMSNITYTRWRKVFYYTLLIAFVAASAIVIYNIQTHWETTPSISEKQEFLQDDIQGRISMPYTDQSLAVRSSFQAIPQTYGYYEQGITNAYADEAFSVSSGFHNVDLTTLYLKATNVNRLYINTEEGERDRIVRSRLNETLPFTHEEGDRYAYFSIPIVDPSFVQVLDGAAVANVTALDPGCRVLFKDEYCGSNKEEFVSTDILEVRYLNAYVDLIDEPNDASATMVMQDPDHYRISVNDASRQSNILVKMTYDSDFAATVDGERVPITKFGPDFMLITPAKEGDYEIMLEYRLSKYIVVGAIVSLLTLLVLIVYFSFRKRLDKKFMRCSDEK